MVVPGVAQLSIVAVIVMLIFGTKRLRQLGGDVGGMFKGIKDGFREAATTVEEIAPAARQLTDDYRAIKRSTTEIADDVRSNQSHTL